MGHQEFKDEALRILENWAKAPLNVRRTEAKERIDIAARRYRYFRSRSNVMPTRAELQTMISRLLRQIQKFHHTIKNLNYWESLWLNGYGPVTPHLLFEIETAEFGLRMAIKHAEIEKFWAQRGHPDPLLILLMDCAEIMAHFNGGEAPGPTKGDRPLVRFTRCVHSYATGKSKDKANFDRQIVAMRRVQTELASIRAPQEKPNL